MRLSIDLDTFAVSDYTGSAVQALSARRGDSFPVHVRFTQGGVGRELPNAATGRLAIKSAQNYAGPLVAGSATWRKVGYGAAAYYVFLLGLNTEPLSTIFASGEVAQASFVIEIEWTHRGVRSTSRAVTFTVENDFIKGSEESPDMVPDSKATQAEAVAGTENGRWMSPLRTFQAVGAWIAQNLSWATLTGKPSTFPPAAHSHPTSEVTGLDTALAGKAAAVHTHTLSQLTQSGATNTQVPTWNGTAWVPATPVVTNFQPNPQYAADSAANAQVSGFGQPTTIFSRFNAEYYTGNDIEYAISRNGQAHGGVAGSWALEYQPSDAASSVVAVSTTATTYPWQATWTNGVTVVKAALPRIVAPLAATASEGTSVYAARADHAHPFPTAAQVGAAPAGSYVTLDGGGKIPSHYLPSYVDDVVEYATLSALQADTAARESGKIYVVLNTGKIYRWSGGTLFIEISNTLELGDLQLPDNFAGVVLNIDNAPGAILSKQAIPVNGKNSYSADGNDEGWQVYYTGTQWRGDWSYSGDGSASAFTLAAAGNTTYPWQATWSNGSVTRVGTYNAALAPAPLGADAYSGVGAKAAREDHVHPLPTPAQIGSLSLSESSYIIAKPGDDLAAKYTAAKALTPNGAAKSATNRASLIIFPGSYTISAELAIDAEFVDVLGLGAQTQTPAVFITGNTLNASANNVRVSGVSVGTQNFKVTGNKPLQVFENCTGGNYSFFVGSEKQLSGKFINCIGGDYSFNAGVYGSVDGTFTGCKAGNNSFAGATYGFANAIFTNCTGGNGCFGGSFARGTYTNCTAGNNSFGGSDYGDANGIFTNCKAGNQSFAGGYGGGANGTYMNCTAGWGSFAGYFGGASGIFMNCAAGEVSFGGFYSSAAGTFTNCTAGASSFGSDSALAKGVFVGCKMTSGEFSILVAPSVGKALMISCIDGSGNIINGQAPL